MLLLCTPLIFGTVEGESDGLRSDIDVIYAVFNFCVCVFVAVLFLFDSQRLFNCIILYKSFLAIDERNRTSGVRVGKSERIMSKGNQQNANRK
jgi:hypothetical protein